MDYCMQGFRPALDEAEPATINGVSGLCHDGRGKSNLRVRGRRRRSMQQVESSLAQVRPASEVAILPPKISITNAPPRAGLFPL
jgi:hypothetical protein